MITSCSAQSEPQSGDKHIIQEIEQFLDDWNCAMVAADTVRLGAMMDESIILRTSAA